MDVRVFVYYGTPRDYMMDGIPVRNATMDEIFQTIIRDCPDACAIHFPVREFCDAYERYQPSMPFGLWFHGVETLSWRRRLFNFTPRLGFLRYIHESHRQLRDLGEFLKANKENANIRLIYVSQWMHDVAESDLGMRISRYHVIPNPIDGGHFAYHPKPAEQRHDILILRSFDSRKYANDLSMSAIDILARRFPDEFREMRFSIYGKGRYFSRLTAPMKSFPNVQCHEEFVPRAAIPPLHAKSGVFLCPTRQDAQGVSMCEAMAGGLVPVTSLSTAIPEFVENGKEGFLTRSVQEIAESLLLLSRTPGLFSRMSAAAATRAHSQCDAVQIGDREMAILSSPVSSSL